MGFPCERARHKIKQQRKKLQKVPHILYHTKEADNSGCPIKTTTIVQSQKNDSCKQQQQPHPKKSDQRPNYHLLTITNYLNTFGNVVLARVSQLISCKLINNYYNNNSNNKKTTSTTITNSHYFVRQSLCLYAASSVLLLLCYLTTPAAGSDTPHPM